MEGWLCQVIVSGFNAVVLIVSVSTVAVMEALLLLSIHFYLAVLLALFHGVSKC
jgi:hypothetical protein